MNRISRIWMIALLAGLAPVGCSQSRQEEPDRGDRKSYLSADSAPAYQNSPVQTQSSESAGDRSTVIPIVVAEAPPPGQPVNDKPTPLVTLEELREHMRNGSALLIDARNPDSFARGHVEGAINISAMEAETQAAPKLRNVDMDQLMIIYCSSARCQSSDFLCEYLTSLGFTNVRVFRPGWVALSKAGR